MPWKDSKLTHLLMDKIGGNNVMIMLGTISPAESALTGSRRTLEFLNVCGKLRQPDVEQRPPNVESPHTRL